MPHWQIVLNWILVSTRSGSLCVGMKSLFNELGEGSFVFFCETTRVCALSRPTAVVIWPSPSFRLDSPWAHLAYLAHSECMENVRTTLQHIILQC
jgi:hypothetical protein